jgi:hypothetical protein
MSGNRIITPGSDLSDVDHLVARLEKVMLRLDRGAPVSDGLVGIRMRVTPDIAHAIATDKEFLLTLLERTNTAVACLLALQGGRLEVPQHVAAQIDPGAVRIKASDDPEGPIIMWLDGFTGLSEPAVDGGASKDTEHGPRAPGTESEPISSQRREAAPEAPPSTASNQDANQEGERTEETAPADA